MAIDASSGDPGYPRGRLPWGVDGRANRAHEVVAAWSRRFERFACVTQNVDGLHERAGTGHVLRFHGSIFEQRCWDRCAGAPERWWDDRVPLPTCPPRCPHCGGLARPGVVWFGEAIDPGVLEASVAAMDCDVCLLIGTSSQVHPAAGLVDVATGAGAFTVEVNLEPTGASARVDASRIGPAEVLLDRLDAALR